MSKPQAREGAHKAPAEQAVVAETTIEGHGRQEAGAAEEKTAAPLPTKMCLEIISVSEKGFWRFGRQFTKAPKTIDVDEFSAEQLKRLDVEVKAKNLIVKMVEARA